MLSFCDICGREILCEDEIGKVDNRRTIINTPVGNHRHTTKTTYCKDCIEDEADVLQMIANSPEAEIEILYSEFAESCQ